MTTLALHAAVLLAAVATEPDMKKDPYPEGERLEYRVKLRGFPGGSATMSVGAREKKDGRETVTLRLRMRSNAFVAKILRYPLDNKWTSVLETKTGGTLSFHLDKNERKRREVEEITVSPETLTGKYYRRRHTGAEERTEFRLDKLTQDSLSLFYHVRRLPLDLGTADSITILHRDKAHELRLMVDGLEKVAVAGVGTVWAKVVHPSVGPGLFSAKGQATLWLEENTHVMLKMVVEAPKGSASMTLVKVERSPLLDAPRVHGGPR